MFELTECQDVVRIPPDKFKSNIKDVALEELSKKYEGIISKELGYVVAIISLEVSPIGKILPGDGATHHSVLFTLLTHKPEVQEIVEGEVIEIGDFGSFIRVGPVEALLHVSQIMDDYIVFDQKQGILTGKETQRKLVSNDKVRARVTAVSISKGGNTGKIGITMRQPFLGKIEWISEDIRRLREPEKAPQKKIEKKETKKR